MKNVTWVVPSLGDTWIPQPHSGELDVDLDLIGYYFIAFILPADSSAILNNTPLGGFVLGDIL